MYPKMMKWYIALVVGTATLLLIYGYGAFHGLLSPAMGLMAIGTTIGAYGSVRLVRGHGELAVDLPILILAAVIFGPFIGAVIGLVATWTRRELNGEIQWPSTVFNHAQFAIIGWVVGSLFEAMGGNVTGRSLVLNLIPLLTVIAVGFLLNIGFVLVALSLRKQRKIAEIFRVNYKALIPSFILMIPIAFLMAGLYQTLGVWGELAFFVPLAAVRWTMTLTKALRMAYFNTIRAILAGLDAKDPYTYGHSMRVGHYGMLLAHHMKMPEDQVEDVRFAGMLHDIGKMGTPDNILNKPGRLNMDELLIMQRHPIVGSAMLTSVQMQGCAASGVLHHHERWDGTGYPDSLRGMEIPIETRLITVVDAYDAMTSDRPYRRAMPHQSAIEEIRAGAGIQFDPSVVEKFMEIAEDTDLSKVEGTGHGWDLGSIMFSDTGKGGSQG